MKRTAVSLQRRQLMIASLAGLAAPILLTPLESRAHMSSMLNVAPRSGDRLVLSGRVVTRQDTPLQGARIETTQGERVHATTDADGRFMLMTTTPGAGSVSYRISHRGHDAYEGTLQLTQLDTAREIHAQRDEDGVWRAAFGVTLA